MSPQQQLTSSLKSTCQKDCGTDAMMDHIPWENLSHEKDDKCCLLTLLQVRAANLSICCENNVGFNIFAQNSSLRGVGKVQKTPHFFIKVLWLTFILAMTMLLSYAVINLIREYFDYHTTIQFSHDINEPSDFPSITFCSHQPFSNNARNFWQSGQVPSPYDFSRQLRNLMRHAMDKGDYNLAKDIFSSDRSTSYYQFLTPNQSKLIGHTANSFFVMCMVRQQDGTIMLGHVVDCHITVREIQNPSYFNCFTASVNSEISRSVTDLAMMVSLSQPPNESHNHEQGFVQNVFSQSRGLRLVLHEKDTFPDIETRGFNVPPALFNEVIYKIFKRVQTQDSGDKCVEEVDAALLQDATETSYLYTDAGCISKEVGRYILSKCNCVSVDHLRQVMPNSSTPYCDALQLQNHAIDQLSKRRFCVTQLDIPSFSKSIMNENNRCPKQCRIYDYESFLSSTQWLPTSWQIYWMMEVSHALQYLSNQTRETASHNKVNLAQESVYKFLNSSNLLDFVPTSDIGKHSIDDHSFIKVSRSGFGITSKEEKLKITASALISRIGGICSLTLGLTCAFFVELIEWLFLFYKDSMSKQKKSSNQNCQHGQCCASKHFSMLKSDRVVENKTAV